MHSCLPNNGATVLDASWFVVAQSWGDLLGRQEKFDSSGVAGARIYTAPGLLYMATENGIVSCKDPESGEIIRKVRLGGVHVGVGVAIGIGVGLSQ
jgi:hypothetical protein